MVKTYEYVFSVDINNNATDDVVPPPPPPEPNKVIHFGLKRSDEEIVYSSKFNLNIDILLNNSSTTRLATRSATSSTTAVSNSTGRVRRRRRLAYRTAVTYTQPAGRSIFDTRRHRTYARVNASCVASSALLASPSATVRPRQTDS